MFKELNAQFFRFHGSPDLIELLLRLSAASPHNETLQLYFLQTACAALPIQRCQRNRLCYHAYRHSAGILTCFPFGLPELPWSLGSTNPQLTNIAEETLLYSVSRILT